MEFNENDFRALVENMAKQNQLMELFYKGWTDFTNNKLKYGDMDHSKGATMKNITKRKDNRYMIRKVINGRRVIKYARTQTEAKKVLRQLVKQTRKYQIDGPKNYTFEEYAQFWLDTYKKPFIKTKSYYEISRFLRKINIRFGKHTLNIITTNEIQYFLNEMPRGRTKEKVFTYFNAIMQKAVDTGIITRNPLNAVIKDKKVKCKNNAFMYAEQVKILEIIKGTDIEHEIITYLMCGCRPNELPDKSQFDFDNNLINIYGTKTENALHRQIEMSEPYSNYMKQYFENHDMQAEKYVSRKFNELCIKAGIEKPLLYKLRHTFATNHFTLGTPAKLVQHWLGHSNISMTLDTYTDIDKTASKIKIQTLYNNYYYIKD
jgi:integrase